MTNKTKILHCPFCGSEDVKLDNEGYFYKIWVHCIPCKTKGPIAGDAEEAIKAWNRAKR